ncbi:MAG: alpha/beta hydrolase [Actinobacteria bacterium]|nr:alpha/beta hydrolase [Actinomycetota bacterium]
MEPVLRSAVIGAALAANAHKPRIRSLPFTIPSFAAGLLVGEAASYFAAGRAVRMVRAWRKGRYATAQGKVALVLDAATLAGLVSLVTKSLQVDDEFAAALASHLDPDFVENRPSSVRNGAFFPLLMGASTTRLTRNVGYVESARWRNTLDIYEPKHSDIPEGERATRPRPAIIEIHGGGWVVGNKNQQGLPLLHHMVKQGWVGFNINYRLAPRAKFPEQLIDCKQAIAWVRENAEQYNVDPNFICVTGGSAGGYLTAMVALTENDPEFQPGFEDSDTSVQAAVPFYGVYDIADEHHAMVRFFPEFMHRVVVGSSFKTDGERWKRFSPNRRIHSEAPPMLVVHGTADTLVPVEQARPFVEALSKVSKNPVVYAELSGANHAFDLFPSPRSVRVTEFVERFLTGVRQGVLR